MSIELSATFATLPKTERGKPLVIHGDPKGKNFLYCNSTNVIIRDIEDPTQVDIYTGHAVATTVAKYSPSGYYIASGDVSGKVRIWDTTQKEHILKNEFQPIGGVIKDISWTGDSQRICVVGEGREKFGHVFNADTGTSTGDIIGQSKSLNSCDFRPSRPMRLVTASEDNSVAFFEGPPFKFKNTLRELTRFANCVRYAPNGETFTSGGAEGKAFVYDGKTGELLRELGSPAHKGGIYAISYSPDSKEILTVSGDKTAKIFEIESGEMKKEFVMGTAVDDMQVGCLWQGEHLLTVSLSGHINYLDRDCTANPTNPLRVIKGHNKPLSAMTTNEDKTVIYTGASDGKICYWDVTTGQAEVMQGKGHSNQIQDMKVVGPQLYSVAMDDTLCVSNAVTHEYGSSVKLPSQPKGMDAIEGGLCVVACINHVVLLRDGNIVFTENVSFEPSCASMHVNGGEVAIGGNEDKTVHVYEVNGDTLVAKTTLVQKGPVTEVAYSAGYLAASNTNRSIQLYQLPDYECLVDSMWGVHSARVNTIDWSPDSNHIASAGLDNNVVILDVTKYTRYQKKIGAHLKANITRLRWLDDNTVATVAQDCCVKIWTIKHAE